MSTKKKVDQNQKDGTGLNPVQNIVSMPIPDEVHSLWCEYQGCFKARSDAIIQKIGGYKKAKAFARDAEYARLRFWRECRELYPEAPEKISYDYYNQKLYWEKGLLT